MSVIPWNYLIPTFIPLPYFIPSEELSGSLIVAALSGIEVNLISPGIRFIFGSKASYSYFKPLLTENYSSLIHY